jgi:predicted enzyme related to lactoylglutathione lyase
MTDIKEQPKEEYTPSPIDTIVSADITSDNADRLRDFYAAVMGWQASPIPIGDYDDYVMMSADGTSWDSGICHLRG